MRALAIPPPASVASGGEGHVSCRRTRWALSHACSPHPGLRFASSLAPRAFRGGADKKANATAHGLLLRSVPDRACQRRFAVSGRVRTVDHLRRDADRQFRPWRVLYARRLRGVHADRAFFRRARVLGRHCRRGADRRRGRRRRRNAAAAADLSRARAVPVARDLRPDADGRRSRGAHLGSERSGRPARAGPEGRARFLRPENSELRSVPDRAGAGRARPALAGVPAHALGRSGARRDAGPRHGGSARRQPEMALHKRVRARRVSGGARRRAANSARCRATTPWICASSSMSSWSW